MVSTHSKSKPLVAISRTAIFGTSALASFSAQEVDAGWKPLHLQYYKLDVFRDIPTGALSVTWFPSPSRDWTTKEVRLTQQTCSLAHFCMKRCTFFLVSTSVPSKQLLWPNKRRRKRWQQTMANFKNKCKSKEMDANLTFCYLTDVTPAINCNYCLLQSVPPKIMKWKSLINFNCKYSFIVLPTFPQLLPYLLLFTASHWLE